MKIDNSRPNIETVSTGQVEATKTAETKAAEVAKQRETDHVSVSDAARFASSAIDAARKAPDVRPDVVERAKALLADGKVGNDPHRLADAMIDSILEPNG